MRIRKVFIIFLFLLLGTTTVYANDKYEGYFDYFMDNVKCDYDISNLIDNDENTYIEFKYGDEPIVIEFIEPIDITQWILSVNSSTNSFWITYTFSNGGGDGLKRVSSTGGYQRVGYYSYKKVEKIKIYVDAHYGAIGRISELDYKAEDSPPGAYESRPAKNRTDVDLNEDIVMNFNERIKNINFSINPEIKGNETLIDKNFRFVHDSFEFNTTYKVKTEFFDLYGNKNTFNWSFTTKEDKKPVEVVNIKPPPGSNDIDIDTGVKIWFNKENIDIKSFDKIFVECDDEIVDVEKSYTKYLSLRFLNELEYEKTYYINIEGVKDVLGNEMKKPLRVSFTTKKDDTFLNIVSVKPPNGNFFPVGDTIKFIFNKNIDFSTIDYLLVDVDGNKIECSFSTIGKKVEFLPVGLEGDTQYIFTLNSIGSVNGKKLDSKYELKFNTLKSSGDKNLDTVINNNVDFLNTLYEHGLSIIMAALLVGLFFICCKWLWRKLKLWIAKV